LILVQKKEAAALRAAEEATKKAARAKQEAHVGKQAAERAEHGKEQKRAPVVENTMVRI
jgi:hypothetical protein